MTERVIDIADDDARLSVRNECLVIAREGHEDTTVPLDRAAVVVISNPRVSVTQAALAGLAQAGGMLVVCDSKRMPAAMLLPLEAHFAQGERFAVQAQAPVPMLKRTWQSIVRAKLRAQAGLLREVRGDDGGLAELASRVRSGDPGNVEAEASRRYWRALFGARFRRNRDGEDENRLLNYGYAVLRAIVARAVCAAGLHPSLGLHHHNRYDAFRLADDLMEPFRPVVDRMVFYYCREHGAGAPLDRDAKAVMVRTLMGRFTTEGEARTLFDIAARAAALLVDVFAVKAKTFKFPEL